MVKLNKGDKKKRPVRKSVWDSEFSLTVRNTAARRYYFTPVVSESGTFPDGASPFRVTTNISIR